MIQNKHKLFLEFMEKYNQAASDKDQVIYAQCAADVAREAGDLGCEIEATYAEGIAHLDLNPEDALKCFTWVISQAEDDSVCATLDNSVAKFIVFSFLGWAASAADIPSTSGHDIDNFFSIADRYISKLGLQMYKPCFLHVSSELVLKYCRFKDGLIVAEEALALKRLNDDVPGCGLDHYLYFYSKALNFNGRYLDALDIASEYINKFSNENAWRWRGQLNFELGKYNESLNDLNEAVFIKETDEALICRSLTYAILGDHFNAVKDLKTVIRRDKKNIEASLWLAGISDQFYHLQHLAETEKFNYNLVNYYLQKLNKDRLLDRAASYEIERIVTENLCLAYTFIGLLEDYRSNRLEAEFNYKCCLGTGCIWKIEYHWCKARLFKLN